MASDRGSEMHVLDWHPISEGVGGSGWLPDNLRIGPSPATVIDVGAGDGTPALYKVFPAAYHVLIEPLEEHHRALAQQLQKLGGELVPCAVGDREASAAIEVFPGFLGLSSMARPVWLGRQIDESIEREVHMTTLDGLLSSRGWTGPFALKIDTEGFEDRVIRGASRLLAETELVIAEVSLVKRFADSCSFAEFIALMDACGFAALDIIDGRKSRVGGRIIYLDVVFRKHNHPMAHAPNTL